MQTANLHTPKVLNNLFISFANENRFVHHGNYFKKLVTQYAPDRQKLADAVGVHRNSLYNLFDDEEISWERWYRIANYLKVDVLANQTGRDAEKFHQEAFSAHQRFLKMLRQNLSLRFGIRTDDPDISDILGKKG